MTAEDDYQPWRPDITPTLTYRQLDYWTRCGYLEPDGNATPGSGHRRSWSADEIRVAAMIGQLRLAGIELATAARVARELRGYAGLAELSKGVWVDVFGVPAEEI